MMPSYLSGGDFIRLFHKEIEGYLISRVNDLHMRGNRNSLRVVYENLLRDPSTFSAIRHSSTIIDKKLTNSVLSLWEVEKEELNDGSLVAWEDYFRIRHVYFD